MMPQTAKELVNQKSRKIMDKIDERVKNGEIHQIEAIALQFAETQRWMAELMSISKPVE